MSTEHMKHLQSVADEDVQHLRMKEATYKGSWKRRGGVGAFMMLARKWDRLEGMLESVPRQYDVFSLIAAQGWEGMDGTCIAEIRDLRRYLLLVEAEMTTRHNGSSAELDIDPMMRAEEKEKMLPGTPEDGGHHEPEFVAPWVVSRDYLLKTWPGERSWEDFYNCKTLDVRVLEPCVSNSVYQKRPGSRILDYYASVPLPNSETLVYVLRIELVPPHLRGYWDRYPRELNSKEHSEMPSWVQALYERHEEAAKWIITDRWRAWTEN